MIIARTSVKDQGRIWPNQHGDGPGSAAGPGRARRIDGDIAAHHQGQAAVPGRGLDPVEGVEEGGGATVAGVGGVYALQVCVPAGRKQLKRRRDTVKIQSKNFH